MNTLKINGAENKIFINILRRTNLDTQDYWDGNWLYSEIKIHMTDFKGFYKTNLRTDDFIFFKNSLEQLKLGESKEAIFRTIEEGLFLKGVLNATGNVQWEGIAKASNSGDFLTFKMDTDNATIDKLINMLKVISKEYPVLGNPK